MMTTVSVSILIEADPPNVVIDSPENTTYSSGINITLNYIASDANGVDSVWYNLDNGENTTVTGNTTFSTSDGSHTLYMFANDTYGLLNDSEFVSFYAEGDTTPPDIIIDSPRNKSYFSGINIALNYIASDANGVDSVWYNLDNGENTTVTGNTTFSTSDGSHTLYMFANDSNNNLNDSKFVNFFIGNPYEEESDDNRDGEIEFSDETINRLLVKLSNLPSGSSANTTLYNQTIPSDWETPSSNVVESVLHYFEINVNESTSGGSYNIYFNLSSAELGSISGNDISAFIYENGNWGELSTAVIDSSSDPISFRS